MKKVFSNLLQQNCYVLDAVRRCDELLPNHQYGEKKYYDLKEIIYPDGSRKEELQELDYPITPESVNSYEESCNYKMDLAGALAKSSPGVNLADVASIQDLGSLDATQARELYQRLSRLFSSEGPEKKNMNAGSIEKEKELNKDE